MQLCHTPAATSAVFDDPNLVSSAGLVPVLALARTAGLHALAQRHLSVPTDKGANAGLKVTSLVAGIQASTSAASLPSPPTPANPFDLAGAMGASREFVEQVTKMQQDFFQHLTGALSAEDPSA